MMKYLLLLLPFYSFGQFINQPFPNMEVQTMEDKTIVLPHDISSKVSLVCLAYSRKSEDDLNSWMAPLFDTFIRQQLQKGGLFSSFAYDVEVYFVPMFTGVNTVAKGTAIKKAVQHIDKQLWPRLLFYQGKLSPYKEALDFEKRDVPYLFLIDTSGKIRYATSGAYTSQKMEAIENAINQL